MQGFSLHMTRTSLSEQVVARLPFLFAEYGAHVVSSPVDDAARAYSTVVVELPSLRLRFSSHRSDLRVEVAPTKLPHRWEELGNVLSWWDIRDGQRQKVYWYSTWEDIAGLLRPNLERLGTRLSAEF